MAKFEVTVKKVDDVPGCGSVVFWLVVAALVLALVKAAGGQ